MSRARNPYSGRPARQFWSSEPGLQDPAAFDPVSDVPFAIAPEDRVVTAGSCFAQHVARRLGPAGLNHHVTEPAHPMIPAPMAATFNYGAFSARYGNLYTTRQFLQLIRRAYGEFTPLARAWALPDGGWADPFRPQIQPGGFASERELAADLAQHLAAVRRAVEEADVLVFTLGLTEAWEDARDGAIFPLAPGVAAGTWDPAEARFRNFDEAETSADLIAALRLVRARNPSVRIILTVSPVALNATMEDRHVYLSTVWSKAVLRLAAERATREIERCCYFPSYEIVTSPFNAGRYFSPDRRQVTPEAVDHVMRLFLKHFARREGAAPPVAPAAAPARDLAAEAVARGLEVQCDEEAISNR